MSALPSLCCLNISNVAHKGWGGGLCVAWNVCKATKKPYNGVSHLGCSSTPDIRRDVIYQGWRNQQGYSQMEGRVCAIIYGEIWRQAGRQACKAVETLSQWGWRSTSDSSLIVIQEGGGVTGHTVHYIILVMSEGRKESSLREKLFCFAW